MNKISFLVIILFSYTGNLNGQDNRFSVGLIGSLESNTYDFKSTSLTENYAYESLIGYFYGIGAEYLDYTIDFNKRYYNTPLVRDCIADPASSGE